MSGKLSTAWRIAEVSFLTLGLVLLGFYLSARTQGVVTLHAAMQNFADAKTAATGSSSTERSPDGIDYSLWSPERIKAYKESETRRSRPLAILRIPKLGIVAPILNGTDDLTLNSGVGRIPGTVLPWQVGNIGIAGHRDGFFRALKDIVRGDQIEVEMARRTDIYVVDKVYVTQPDDVNVLRQSSAPELTLVTCYPFYYIGSAPQRYIVQASRQTTGAVGSR